MTLAGDQHDVPGAGHGHGAPDSGPPIGDCLVIFPAQGGCDLAADGLGIFAPRVVGGDNAPVGGVLGGPAHRASFGPVTIPAAAEDGDEARRFEAPQRAEDTLQGIRRVGVIDEDPENFWPGHHLQPSWNLGCVLERVDRLAHIVPEGVHCGEGGQRVVDIERAVERKAYEKTAATGMQ